MKRWLPMLILIVITAGVLAWWMAVRPPSSSVLPQTQVSDEITVLQEEKYEPQVGSYAPLFELDTFGGQKISPAQFRGQPVILEFWTSWCTNCLATVPHLKAFQSAHKEVAIIAINMGSADRKEDVEMFVEEHQPNYIIALDPQGEVTRLYQIYQTSTAVFIDPQGVIRVIHPGKAMALGDIERFYQQTLQAARP